MFPRTGRILLLLVILLVWARILLHEQQPPTPPSANPSPIAAQQQEFSTATQAMNSPGHEHHMGPHMRMSTLRSANAADSARAQQLVDTARATLERYKDVRIAEADGFRIFLPNVKQPMYHFTNWQYGFETTWMFNPAHPTSLLYEKTADNDFKLIGAMYTAPASF